MPKPSRKRGLDPEEINRDFEVESIEVLRQVRFFYNPITWAALTLTCNTLAVATLIGGAR